MEHSKNIRAAKILAFAVSAAGLAVMAGWLLDIGVLKSLSPDWITMKFSTAFTFVLSGAILYLLAGAGADKGEKARVFLPLFVLPVFFIMGTHLVSFLLGVTTGVEDLFIKDLSGTATTVVPGRPSFPAMVAFLIIASAGVAGILGPGKMRGKFKAVGLFVGLTGAVAAAGYLFDFPALYYFVAGRNSAMAFMTAALFVLLGTGFLCLSEQN